jgi:hypothetical protein
VLDHHVGIPTFMHVWCGLGEVRLCRRRRLRTRGSTIFRVSLFAAE